MIPIFQRTKTDCFRSCIASVLEIDWEEVPDLAEERNWLEMLKDWARGRGLKVVHDTQIEGVPPRAYCVMATEWNGEGGRSRRGHSVVFKKGEGAEGVIHDPWPAGGKLGEPMYWLWFEGKR